MALLKRDWVPVNDFFPKWLFFRDKLNFFSKKSVFFETWIAVTRWKINGFEKMKIPFTRETLTMPTWQKTHLESIINEKCFNWKQKLCFSSYVVQNSCRKFLMN